MAGKRLSKAQRRQQLMDVAYDIVRQDGTDGLTLARLAEAAGVSKPVAYEHFGTRGGLLLALYREYDDRQNARMREALAVGGRSLPDTAAILARSYVDCGVSSGAEIRAITAALTASDDTEGQLQDCYGTFLAECRQALEPLPGVDRRRLDAALLAFIGAAEALVHAAATGALTPEAATRTLTDMLVGAVQEPVTTP